VVGIISQAVTASIQQVLLKSQPFQYLEDSSAVVSAMLDVKGKRGPTDE
jgi:hypothetical protein